MKKIEIRLENPWDPSLIEKKQIEQKLLDDQLEKIDSQIPVDKGRVRWNPEYYVI